MSLIINPYNFAVTTVTPLLDLYSTAAGAYSVRKLRTAYSGSALRVTRSNDNAESDIGFDGSGNLDESALATFVGANSAYVTTWYDQSGNGRNATQTTSSSQPRIVNAGTIEKLNGKPALKFDATDDYFVVDSAIASDFTGEDKPISMFSVWAKAALDQTYCLDFTLSNSGSVAYMYCRNNTGLNPRVVFAKRPDIGTGLTSTSPNTTLTTDTQYLFQIVHTGTNAAAYLNGLVTAEFNVVFNTGTLTLNTAHIGKLTFFESSTQYANAQIQETVIYAADKTSDRTGIRDNINTYFGVY